jgi:hypothetical protein
MSTRRPVLASTLAMFASAALLTACASVARPPSSMPAAAGSPSQSYVVYPAPGTAVVENNEFCQLARDTAVPAAKRSSAAAECNRLLSKATDPVTKPALPDSPSVPPTTTTGPAAKECTAAQLRARFAGGGRATGNDFGAIEVWNPSTRPCQVHGAVAFAAYYADSSLDRNAIINGAITVAPVTLPSNRPTPRDGKELSGYLMGFLMGPERDDPTQPNALCRPRDEGTPATLVLTIGSISLRVTNHDAGSAQITAVYGCHGSVLLESVDLS